MKYGKNLYIIIYCKLLWRSSWLLIFYPYTLFMNWNIVLVWAGWTGMSAVAGILYELWYWNNLICLDWYQGELTDRLQKKWIKVLIWSNKYKVWLFDHVIYSEACVNSPEVQMAKSYERTPKQGRFIWNYFQFLWEISKYFTTIWIAGTNWKSSTTSMLIYVAKKHLEDLWLGVVWALVPDLDWNNYYLNQKKKEEIKNIFDHIFSWRWLDYDLIKKNYFIIESCEYKRHFLMLDTDFWAITNIELDHTDYYKDIGDYTSAFQEWAGKIKHIVFSTEKLDVPWIEQIMTTHFNFKKIFWEHNDKNWSIVFEMIKKLDPNVDEKELKESIENFGWLWRRMELLRKNENWAMIFSDYGHMASSIKLCYDALKQHFPDKKLTAIFQPHQINRVLREWHEFSEILKQFDNAYIYNIYAARENLDEQLENFKHLKIKNADSIDELWNIFAKNCNWQYLTQIEQVKNIINDAKNNEIVAVFSAWDLDYQIR